MPTNNSRFTDHSIHDDFYQIKPKRDFSFVEFEDHTQQEPKVTFQKPKAYLEELLRVSFDEDRQELIDSKKKQSYNNMGRVIDSLDGLIDSNIGMMVNDFQPDPETLKLIENL